MLNEIVLFTVDEINLEVPITPEQYCRKQFSCHKCELLTGINNLNAQMVYDKLGYKNDGEIHFPKITLKFGKRLYLNIWNRDKCKFESIKSMLVGNHFYKNKMKQSD